MPKNNFLEQAEKAHMSMTRVNELTHHLHTDACLRIHDEWVCSPHCKVLEQLPWLLFVESWHDKLLKPEIHQGIWYGSGEPDHRNVPGSLFTREQAAQVFGITPNKVEETEGWGARLSAPGYLDSTEWEVFDTEEEAKAFLMETYGED